MMDVARATVLYAAVLMIVGWMVSSSSTITEGFKFSDVLGAEVCPFLVGASVGILSSVSSFDVDGFVPGVGDTDGVEVLATFCWVGATDVDEVGKDALPPEVGALVGDGEGDL